VTPEDNKTTVFKRGISKGLSNINPWGGQEQIKSEGDKLPS
jgi:hypothetical protein